MDYVFIFTICLLEFRQLLFLSVKRRIHFVQGPLILPSVKTGGRATHCRLFVRLPSMTMLLLTFLVHEFHSYDPASENGEQKFGLEISVIF